MPGSWALHGANIIVVTQTAPAVSGKPLSVCCAPDSREVADLPRIYIHCDPESTSSDQEAKIQESSDPAWRQPNGNGGQAQKQRGLVITGKFFGAQARRIMGAAEVLLWVWLLCLTGCSQSQEMDVHWAWRFTDPEHKCSANS